MILIGELSLWVAMLMAAWGATVSFAGGRNGRPDLIESGERAIHATFALILLASIGLWTALLTHDFSLEHVASNTSRNMPAVYIFAAFRVGQAGSLLFWCLVLAGSAAFAVLANRSSNRELMPWVTGTLAVTLLFFIATMCLGANPYARLDWMPMDGRGLDPRLRNPGMAIHPPMLYLGYATTTIPFALTIAALLSRRLDAEWVAAVRRWSLLSWLFLTIAIVLGMRAAYLDVGRDGFWAWAPVENASILPWLTATAFLHSIMVQAERGVLRKWTIVLVSSSFLLSIVATFIARTGVIESVNAFAQSPIGGWIAGFLTVATAVTAYLVLTRLPDLRATAGPEGMVSREAAVLSSNVVLIGIAFSVLWGTLFPVLAAQVRTVTIPLGLLLLALTGIGPLTTWRRATLGDLRNQLLAPAAAGLLLGAALFALGMRNGYALVACTLAAFVAASIVQELVTGAGARRRLYGEGRAVALVRLVTLHRRRYGGYVVHAGIALLFAAFAGLAFRQDHDVSLAAGETFEATDPLGHEWRFVSSGISHFDALDREVTAIVLDVTRDGAAQEPIVSELRQHIDSRGMHSFEPSTKAGLRESLTLDTYVVLAGISGDEATERAELRISFNPLVTWVWIGGALMAIGGIIVMWPQAERRRAEDGAAAVVERGAVAVRGAR